MTTLSMLSLIRYLEKTNSPLPKQLMELSKHLQRDLFAIIFDVSLFLENLLFQNPTMMA
jgi:hypothetical protein